MNQIDRARPLLGTLAQISVQSSLSPTDLHAAIDAAFAEIVLIHTLMSWHDPSSELCRLNRSAADSIQILHPYTRTVLEAALHFARLSNGAFDPCVAGTLTRWGLLPNPQPSSLLVRPANQASWRDIELSAEGVRYHRPLWVDLGGIAKGFAVDLALQSLLQRGIPDIVVNAGGDLRVAGSREHLVSIRHPQSAHFRAYQLSLRNEALATSSAFDTHHQLNGSSVCALVDPVTSNAYGGADSVSVRAATCMTADALTKIALFAPDAVAESAFEACAAFCIRLSPETS